MTALDGSEIPPYLVDGCPFCAIIAGTAPATIVARSTVGLAIVPLHPVTDGHLLVIPLDHVPDALADPLVTATTAAWATELAESPCNLITSVGTAATQTVQHLHWHIVPRREGDGLTLPWGTT